MAQKYSLFSGQFYCQWIGNFLIPPSYPERPRVSLTQKLRLDQSLREVLQAGRKKSWVWVSVSISVEDSEQLLRWQHSDWQRAPCESGMHYLIGLYNLYSHWICLFLFLDLFSSVGICIFFRGFVFIRFLFSCIFFFHRLWLNRYLGSLSGFSCLAKFFTSNP